ncbi:MAG: GNAT family N-acetyltransferase [Flavobacteriales bacterium]|nr:GNAT family N-acetyltransferase [Flavobacteriales bacterium]
MQFVQYDAFQKLPTDRKNQLVKFLYRHLGAYGDSPQAIGKSIEYAMKERPAFGGFVLLAMDKQEILGAVVLNKTGMDEYIPEYILVYVATHSDHRGKGIGRRLMQAAMDKCSGSIALHVEPDNPALQLYEKLGFTNKYLEMRLHR